MNHIKLCFIILMLIHPLFGQVCCSLVGTVDRGGGGAASLNWGTHWPSNFDNKKSFKWASGINTSHTADEALNIRYGASLSVHGLLSHYIGQRTIGYLKIESTWLQIEEFLSFSNSSSQINQLGFRTGFRHLLPEKWGFIFGELRLPKSPTFANPKFPFTTGAVPVFMIGYTNQIQMPWAIKSPLFLPELSWSVSLAKNQKMQADVYLDDELNAHISSFVYSIYPLAIIPFISIQAQKLLAPLSPWESERQTRRLNVMTFGLDFTPTHHNWKWIHLRFDLPIYQWTSNGNFPDGAEPVPRVSLSITKSGTIRNSWGNEK
ncbi:MAG: hypothetical protein HN657_01030 [Candidatus Marinimicrobia bacterium]|nr:hypothetical protein [Candidatus Neomarinimicrobiota bacterium]MBT3496915.1 hypothetical protein [Candidatus Neomarinimicrobiota bacterium]MBT3692645.1 hypothetical protein [Candidatus Neomarinimicrobiota bacterium]MBT3732824.1 hypothetical protein [Candidatus Neomarinimicrobiota bacterium]MBT4144062.1 hypothetical protein [Candidatus Neomarinimicrobiota bacterium]